MTVRAQTPAPAGTQISTDVTATFEAAPNGLPATATAPPVAVTVQPPPDQPVYRLLDPFNDDHFYTVSPAEVQAAAQGGYVVEGVIGGAPAAGAGTAPVYRFFYAPTGAHFYTSDPATGAYALSLGCRSEGVAFQVRTAAGTDTAPLWQFYWPAAGKYFYTTSPAEYSAVLGDGFLLQGAVGYLDAAPG